MEMAMIEHGRRGAAPARRLCRDGRAREVRA